VTSGGRRALACDPLAWRCFIERCQRVRERVGTDRLSNRATAIPFAISRRPCSVSGHAPGDLRRHALMAAESAS
jgi:hypothetical protein